MQPNNSSAYLIIRQGYRWTDVFRLESGRPLIIGRASSNEIPVADERSSRRHAEIFFEEGSWKVRDLGSRNGTYVDGQRISEAKSLVAGNQITVAACRLTFAYSLDEVVPPLELDETAPQTTQHTQGEIPAITYRQSKSSILDPASHQLDIKSPSNSVPVPHRAFPAIATELLQLAFEVAREPNIQSACELALNRLMQSTGCKTGGVLKLEPSSDEKDTTKTNLHCAGGTSAQRQSLPSSRRSACYECTPGQHGHLGAQRSCRLASRRRTTCQFERNVVASQPCVNDYECDRCTDAYR